MKATGILTLSVLMLLLAQFFTSCEMVEPTPKFTELTIELNYKGLENFNGQFSQIRLFIIREDGGCIINSADEIESNQWSIRLLPGIYTISAEYKDPDSQAENIVLGRIPVDVKAGEKQKLILTVNLNRVNSNTNQY